MPRGLRPPPAFPRRPPAAGRGPPGTPGRCPPRPAARPRGAAGRPPQQRSERPRSPPLPPAPPPLRCRPRGERGWFASDRGEARQRAARDGGLGAAAAAARSSWRSRRRRRRRRKACGAPEPSRAAGRWWRAALRAAVCLRAAARVKPAALLGPMGLFAAGLCSGLRRHEVGNSPFGNCGQPCESWEQFGEPGLWLVEGTLQLSPQRGADAWEKSFSARK